ncbi:Glutathione-dependent formaldehyde-activating enzyme [Roseovarius litorisediminis]|uniref:Glutathione-dependent formaldehyde-activating enzyme n=1 Tax=Roseovarius litorisediminis TaxID=1312363 RepID=A0A1Y5S1W6_9RHOB|nr:GFA family protein [Roseovarius litorisediminis]SLN29393.1 Glutathione-dependent formaldehyde-activating enzyme [Roseovarius litorisediminis]
MIHGNCLCGAVSFTVDGPLGRATCCHCSQCRKQSGHYWASSSAKENNVTVTGEVQWYEASPAAKRGFCPTCGSFLFWKANDEDRISFSLGLVQEPTGLRLESHIFVADKGDYYEIADGLPQLEKS